MRDSSSFEDISVYILSSGEATIYEHAHDHRDDEYDDIGIEEYDTPDRRAWTESAESPSDTEQCRSDDELVIDDSFFLPWEVPSFCEVWGFFF